MYNLSEIGIPKTIQQGTKLTGDIADLKSAYRLTMLKLEECAGHVCGNDKQIDEKIDRFETDLLDFQDRIINKISQIKIRNNVEVKELLEFWYNIVRKETDVSTTDEMIIPIITFFNSTP